MENTVSHSPPLSFVPPPPEANEKPRREGPCKYKGFTHTNFSFTNDEITTQMPILEDSQLLTATPETLYPIDLRHKVQFARLLIDANIISAADVAVIMDISAVNDLTLSETICIFSVLTPHMRNICDELLREAETGALTYDQVVVAFNHIYFTGCSVLEALALVGSSHRNNWSILEILEAASIVTEKDVDRLAPMITDAESIPRLLLEKKILDQRVLQIATRLRYLLRSGTISPAQAAVAMRSCHRDEMDVDDFLVEQGWKLDRSPPVVPSRSRGAKLEAVA